MKTLTFLEAIAELERLEDSCSYAERVNQRSPICIFRKRRNSQLEFMLEREPGVFTESYIMEQDILRGEYVIKRIEVQNVE